ncbi:Golgi membrane protein 1-like isoform X1 [Stigmatopora nigra]
MGGLVNGWRGRSPPLMIGALVACLLLLGFNYWVSSSCNLELQAKLYEMEAQVRRVGAAEVKKYELQVELNKQKDQTARIESLYKKQMEKVQNTCNQEKATLEQNVSAATKTIQELKDQLNEKNNGPVKLEKELQACQSNVKTLNDKLTYDMTQCNSQLLSQKELCDERVTAAKLEAQKKENKAENNGIQVIGTLANVSLKALTNLSHFSNRALPSNILNKQGGAGNSESNRQSDMIKDDTKKPEVAVSAHDSKSSLTNNQTHLERMAANIQAAEPQAGQVPTDKGISDTTIVEEKLNEEDNYDQQMLEGRGLNLDKQQGDITVDKVMDLADYNGDDENEGEFEADKQAQLAQI